MAEKKAVRRNKNMREKGVRRREISQVFCRLLVLALVQCGKMRETEIETERQTNR